MIKTAETEGISTVPFPCLISEDLHSGIYHNVRREKLRR